MVMNMMPMTMNMFQNMQINNIDQTLKEIQQLEKQMMKPKINRKMIFTRYD